MERRSAAATTTTTTTTAVAAASGVARFGVRHSGKKRFEFVLKKTTQNVSQTLDHTNNKSTTQDQDSKIVEVARSSSLLSLS